MSELKRLLEAAKRVKSRVEVEERNLSTCVSLTSDETSLPRLDGQTAQEANHHSSTSTSNFDSTNEWHTLFLIGIYTGLRLGDCCRLDWSQINLREGVIQVVPRKTRRHHQRMVTIPIHPKLGAELLASQVKVKGEGEQWNVTSSSAGQQEQEDNFLCSPSPSTFTFLSGPVLPGIAELYARARSRIADRLSSIFKAANITTSVLIEGRNRRTPEATFHSLRHTFVSFAANAGVPLHIVQSIVGHESTAMTRHYYHENLTALKSAVAAIPTL